VIKYCLTCKENTKHYLDVHPTKLVLVPYCSKCYDRRKEDTGRSEGERRRNG